MNLVFNTLLAKIILIISLTSFTVATSRAQTTTSTTGQFTHLNKGDSAPFDGTLFDPIAVAKILSEREFAKKECDLRIERELGIQQSTCRRDIDLLKSELEIEKKKYELIVGAQQEEIEVLRNLAKGNDNMLWTSVGFALGAVTSVAIFFAAVEIIKK